MGSYSWSEAEVKVTIEFKKDNFAIEVLGSHKFWAFQSHLTVPISCLRAISLREGKYDVPWIKAPGTAWPGKIIAGTFHGKARKEFWDTNCRGDEIQIDLKDHEYTRIVVEVESATATLDMMSSAIGVRL